MIFVMFVIFCANVTFVTWTVSQRDCFPLFTRCAPFPFFFIEIVTNTICSVIFVFYADFAAFCSFRLLFGHWCTFYVSFSRKSVRSMGCLCQALALDGLHPGSVAIGFGG